MYSFLRASCRIRTNDPEITNHVLWPTELKRRVGKLTISLEDSKGAGRMGLTRISFRTDAHSRHPFAGAKVGIFSECAISPAKKIRIFTETSVFSAFYIARKDEKAYFCRHY